MEFNEGDLVTRKSHNHDTIFTITSIDADTALLKGINIRLVADSPLDDLELYNDDDSENEKEFLDRIKPKQVLDRNDYFYLPGKILHIDTEFQLNNTLTNPYKIRKKSIFENGKIN